MDTNHATPDDAVPHDVDGQVLGLTFADLGLCPALVATLVRLKYDEPTPIQQEAIPHLLAGSDLLGQAATGTGKTAAFALPILERVANARGRVEPIALVLAPTRELAVQVTEAIDTYGRDLGVKALAIYGGQPIGRQVQALKRGVHVVVATPGRALDHLTKRTLSLDAVEMVVLDEADEMLDMGFADDLEAILAAVPDNHQTILFSATLPPRIDHIARHHLQDPVRIRISATNTGTDDEPLIRETAYLVARYNKAAALGRLLDVEAPTSAIVFCRTRMEVEEVAAALNGRGYRAEPLHGGMSQEQRDRVMGRLRNQSADLLVATDVAARGLDIDQLSHVINYDVPKAPESYVHRIGRVGRAGREGVAITLVEPREQRLLSNIERLTKRQIPISPVPSVMDLRTLQREKTTTAMRNAMGTDDLHQYNEVVGALAEEYEMTDIALAAVKLLHESTQSTATEQDIPAMASRADGGTRKSGSKSGQKHGKTKGAGSRSGSENAEVHKKFSGTTTKLFINLGKADGVRPKDLVGAIANETRLSGRQIGPISITDAFSTVGVPADAAEEVIKTMKHTTIKGKKAKVRRDLKA